MTSTVVVWGAGAMGGTLGACLADAGEDVIVVDRWHDHVEAIHARGLRVTGAVAELTVHPPAYFPEELRGRYPLVFLCVKAQDTEAAVRDVSRHLTDEGTVVSVQNGLNERVIAREIGERRTLGCFVNFGADVTAPGVIHWGGRGTVVVGELDGRITERARHVRGLLRLLEPNASLTGNIWGYLWAKLAYGALLFATALTNASIAEVLSSADHRPALLALAREVVAVARAGDITLEEFDGFRPTAFLPAASDHAAYESLDALAAFNRGSTKTHSGVWRDLAVRRRRTEVDAQLGVVADLGAEVGVPTPLLRRLIRLIHDVEDGRRTQSWGTLAALGARPGIDGGAVPS